VSTASRDGRPYLTPLWFVWHGGALLMCTRAGNPTAVNIRATGRAVVSLGHPRDVVLIEADARAVPVAEAAPAEVGAFVAAFGWDVGHDARYCLLRCRPRTVRAWRDANEQPGRLLMRDGAWLV
jgi:hypothetical protein